MSNAARWIGIAEPEGKVVLVTEGPPCALQLAGSRGAPQDGASRRMRGARVESEQERSR